MPGALSARTGGTRYDVRLAEALTQAGADCRLVGLDGAFPGPDATGAAALAAAFAAVPADRLAVVDGLCLATLASLPDLPPFLALMHHPADLETGLAAPDAARLHALETRALARAAHIVASSAHTADMLVGQYGVAADRLGAVPPGLTVAPPAAASPKQESDTRGPLRLLMVAGVTPRKGHEILLEALVLLRASGPDLPDFAVDCYGSLTRDPEWVAGLRATIAEQDLDACVHLHGEIDETALAAAYVAADLYVHTAWYEGYGMALADALACGLPVVATAGGAVADLVPPQAGLLVPPGDAAAFAAALARLLGDPAARRHFAAGARHAGARLPDWPGAAALFALECLRVTQ